MPDAQTLQDFEPFWLQQQVHSLVHLAPLSKTRSSKGTIPSLHGMRSMVIMVQACLLKLRRGANDRFGEDQCNLDLASLPPCFLPLPPGQLPKVQDRGSKPRRPRIGQGRPYQADQKCSLNRGIQGTYSSLQQPLPCHRRSQEVTECHTPSRATSLKNRNKKSRHFGGTFPRMSPFMVLFSRGLSLTGLYALAQAAQAEVGLDLPRDLLGIFGGPADLREQNGHERVKDGERVAVSQKQLRILFISNKKKFVEENLGGPLEI